MNPQEDSLPYYQSTISDSEGWKEPRASYCTVPLFSKMRPAEKWHRQGHTVQVWHDLPVPRLIAQSSLHWAGLFHSLTEERPWASPAFRVLQIPCWKGQRWFLSQGAHSLVGIQLSTQVRGRPGSGGGNRGDSYKPGSILIWFKMRIFCLIKIWPWFWFLFNVALNYLSWFLCFWHLLTFCPEANTSLQSLP